MSRFYDAMRRASDEPAAKESRREGEREHQEAADRLIEVVQPQESSQRNEVEIVETPRSTTVIDRVESPAEGGLGSIDPSYERIIQKLFAFKGGQRHCVVLVASATLGEGCSTVARNLARALSRSQQGQIALVDANFRSPSVQGEFEVSLTEGLSEVLSGSSTVDNALTDVPNTNLSLLAAGRPPENPNRLLGTRALRKAVATLQSRFDWVVVDCPPVTAYPDVSSIAVVCDCALLVLRAERTRREVAEQAIKNLSQTGITVLGAILNRRKYHIPRFLYKRL